MVSNAQSNFTSQQTFTNKIDLQEPIPAVVTQIPPAIPTMNTAEIKQAQPAKKQTEDNEGWCCL